MKEGCTAHYFLESRLAWLSEMCATRQAPDRQDPFPVPRGYTPRRHVGDGPQLFAIQGNMASRRRKYSTLWAQLNESNELMSLPGWVGRGCLA